MKYTLITGATSGIGEETARTYANKGHDLILIARRHKLLQDLKTSLEEDYDVKVLCFKCDLNNSEEVNDLFLEINKSYNIECLINNAGIGIFDSIKTLKLEDINKQNQVNFTAPVMITQILIDNIVKNKGSIINVCSVLSYIPHLNSSIYVSTKHALYGFSNSVRLEYPGLHVMTVHPITVKTEFFDEDYYKKIKNVLTPKMVADKIFNGYKRKKRKINLPKSLSILQLIYLWYPKLVDKLNIKYFSKK